MLRTFVRGTAVGAAAHAGHEGSHIVVGHAAADDEDALVAQRRQRPPDADMLGRIHAREQRHLDNRNIGVRESHFQRDEKTP